MNLRKTLVAAAALLTYVAAVAVPIHSKSPAGYLITRESDGLQNIVTWDEKSIFVRGERVVIYSGEFHPFRLPVPDLWLDIFQKIKALGYNGVSFYVDWALLEGQQGTYRASGVFALEPFFEAASEAGIYLLARPGPYINAEVSGGGFPGWLDRVDAPYHFRTNNTNYINATTLYARSVGETIANAQITNGGPIILAQPENEYNSYTPNAIFPNDVYFGEVIDQLRNAGIVIPLISNDASPQGLFAPGNPNYTVHVDIYGYDAYPQGFDCQKPYYWAPGNLPTDWTTLHRNQSPSTPNSIVEFQGGSFDPWGGYGFDNCAALTNAQFERVFYKNNWSFQVTFFNIYMTYGGTNWGNLGHPLGYSSYDYGAVIREDRAVTRTKYSEAKLLANFLKVTPGFATAEVMLHTNTSYVSTPDLTVTALLGNGTQLGLYIIRHSQYQSNDTTPYTLTVPISAGNVTIPQLTTFSDHLSLDGRDSKVHVVGYPVGDAMLQYSSAEVFTWGQYQNGTVLVLYGGEDEVHEFALSSSSCNLTSGDSSSVAINSTNSQQIVQWKVTPDEKIVTCDNLTIHLLWRNDAYNWWTLELPAESPLSNFTSYNKTSVIVKGGNLMRTAQIVDGGLYLTGDLNETTTVTIEGSPNYNSLYFNGKDVGASPATIEYTAPTLNLPDLNQSSWQSLDSLPELSSSYNDAKWPVANDPTTVNQFQPNTSEVLYAGQYGFHCGSLIYRGHFTAPSSGGNLDLSLITRGGQAYGYTLWLNGTNIYQYPGVSTSDSDLLSMQLTNLTAGAPYVLVALIDHMGLQENYDVGNNTMQVPRGVIDYNLTASGEAVPITWKVTGNLGGENYLDLTRGPLNEGAMFFERQGYHLPLAPDSAFNYNTTPYEGFSGPGVRFYRTTFNLSLPVPEYDIPLAITFTNSSDGSLGPESFRSVLFVNGFQFGKYVNHIGPQLEYPVPEGILNYNGENWLGVSLWNMEDGNVTVKLAGFQLKTSSTPTMSGRYRNVNLSYQLPEDGWHQRDGYDSN